MREPFEQMFEGVGIVEVAQEIESAMTEHRYEAVGSHFRQASEQYDILNVLGRSLLTGRIVSVAVGSVGCGQVTKYAVDLWEPSVGWVNFFRSTRVDRLSGPGGLTACVRRDLMTIEGAFAPPAPATGRGAAMEEQSRQGSGRSSQTIGEFFEWLQENGQGKGR